jgi:hypothetical protein
LIGLKKLPTIQKALYRSTPTMATIDHQCLHLYVIVSAENAHGDVSSKRASGMQKLAVQTCEHFSICWRCLKPRSLESMIGCGQIRGTLGGYGAKKFWMPDAISQRDLGADSVDRNLNNSLSNIPVSFIKQAQKLFPISTRHFGETWSHYCSKLADRLPLSAECTAAGQSCSVTGQVTHAYEPANERQDRALLWQTADRPSVSQGL